MEEMDKAKAAFYWASSCGGCEISILEVGAKILDVIAAVDIVFWPCIADFKYADVEAMPDGSIDVCFFNGAIRNEENLHIARLLRRKSKYLIAYGSCAHTGGIPSLANYYSNKDLQDRIYDETPSTINPERTRPLTRIPVPEGELTLPAMFERAYKLDDLVPVDYYVPGCPAVPESTLAVFTAILTGNLPAAGSVVGIKAKSVCDECSRERKEKMIKRFFRPQEIIPDPKECLLDQGLICMGPATQAGCGGQCTSANQGCRGCYGAPAGVEDQGLKMVSVLGSIVDAEDPAEAKKIIDQIVDPAGTFYRFATAASTLGGMVRP
jgi:F420-non-reducing hydrogenase small subunit